MSIVVDRRCDGCRAIVEQDDRSWWALIPPGWDGDDRRHDFCNLSCLKKWAKSQ